jgi:hypothetical protein
MTLARAVSADRTGARFGQRRAAVARRFGRADCKRVVPDAQVSGE